MCLPTSNTTVLNPHIETEPIRPSKDDMRKRVKGIFESQRKACSKISAKSLVERASLGNEDLFSKEGEPSSLKKKCK